MARSKKLRRAGIDVSAKELHVAVEGTVEVLSFDNTSAGHKALLKKLTKGGYHARVVVEATSTYHLDLCLTLDAHKRVQVMVANPRSTKHFHNAQGIRAKTDKVDARSLLAFAMHMPFEPWTRPTEEQLELRMTARYVSQLVKQQTRLKNQLAAADSYQAAADWVVADLHEQLAQIGERIDRAKQRVTELARRNPEIGEHVANLDSIPGIGEDTAARLIAELQFLDPQMTPKQVTAWAGLDPRPHQSGTSRNGRRPISKRGNSRVRGLMYMPAMAAARGSTPLGEFYRRVEARSGHSMIAKIALMRRMLVISWALYRSQTRWDASKAAPRHPSQVAA